MGSDKKGHVDAVTPLVNGFLTGQLQALFLCCNRLIFLELAQFDPILKKKLLPFKHFPHMPALKRDLLGGAICSTASLGTFEILSKWVRNIGNEGRPLGLNQEACCGLISGATAMFIWQPFSLAYNRVGLHHLTYTNWVTTLSHMLKNETPSSLWRANSATTATTIAAYMGMLASYDRTLNYLTHTQALSESNAQISASITSGFFAAASAHSFQYLGIITKAVQTRIQEGERRAITRIIRQVLTPHSGFNFYDAFLTRFRHASLFCLYPILEAVRKVEWTSLSSSGKACQT
ncbi:hypothetical protein C2S52_015688 [Perilla frutescens var. hirtella]|nr:hypothetical protein C2S52_015688 [Perilla frutescens var. hirtella]